MSDIVPASASLRAFGLVDEIDARASGLHTGQWDAALANARAALAKKPTDV